MLLNVLILGGNGYLGSKVTRQLIEAGNCVVCTKRQSSDLSRLSDLEKSINWIPASIDSVDTATKYTPFDYVLNMACNYGRENVLYDNVLDANIEFPLKVLNKTVERGTKKFITIGTGLPDELNMYSFSKKMMNEFGRFYSEKHGIDFCSLQLEMFYGADEPGNRFLPSIINGMIKGAPIDMTLGPQRRDIISVEDIIKAVITVFHSDLHGYHEVPVGTGIAPTISEIVDFIWEETGKKSKLNKGAVPLRKNEPDCVADITKISSIGPWNPIPWKQGIKQMIEIMEGRK